MMLETQAHRHQCDRCHREWVCGDPGCQPHLADLCCECGIELQDLWLLAREYEQESVIVNRPPTRPLEG